MQKRDRNRGDELLIGALAAGSPVEQAAETAGVSVRTVYRRLADPNPPAPPAPPDAGPRPQAPAPRAAAQAAADAGEPEYQIIIPGAPQPGAQPPEQQPR